MVTDDNAETGAAAVPSRNRSRADGTGGKAAARVRSRRSAPAQPRSEEPAGLTVAVTGAASGLGRGLAARLVAHPRVSRVVAVDSVRGDLPGVTWRVVDVRDPSLVQRLLSLAMVLPGLLLVVEIARRLRHLLRAAQVSDPFRADTAHALTLVAKVTAVGGVAVWAVGQASQGLLAASVLTSPVPFRPQESPLGWLAVALILAGFGQLLGRGVAMRAELDTVI